MHRRQVGDQKELRLFFKFNENIEVGQFVPKTGHVGLVHYTKTIDRASSADRLEREGFAVTGITHRARRVIKMATVLATLDNQAMFRGRVPERTGEVINQGTRFFLYG